MKMHHTLEAKLNLEARICPQCRYKITNPFITRCPRCLKIVTTEELGCTSCIHGKSCPAISNDSKIAT